MTKQVKTIGLAGIIRNTPDKDSKDGSLLEAINMRFRDGAWRGVGDKVATGKKAVQSDTFSHICYHPALPADTYVLLNETDNKVYTILFTESGTETPSLVLDLGSEAFNRFSHLGNVLLIFTNTTKYILYWDKTSLSYKNLTFLPVPIVNVTDSDKVEVNIVAANYADPSPIPDAGLDSWNLYEYHRSVWVGEYLNQVTEKRKDNLIDGYVVVRLAYKLFDGSYIKHTQPLVHHIGYSAVHRLNMRRDGNDTYIQNAIFAKLNILYNLFGTGDFTLTDYSDMGIIESLDFFISRPIDGFDVTKDITHWTTNSGLQYPPFNTELVKVIMDEPCYKVHSVPLKDIVTPDTTEAHNIPKANVVIPDLTKEISANPLLPEDNFSHHTVNSLDDFEYNSRLHLANIATTISEGFNPFYHANFVKVHHSDFGYEQITIFETTAIRDKYLGAFVNPEALSSDVKIYQQVWLKTESGRKVITSEVQSSFVSGFSSPYNVPNAFGQYAYNNGAGGETLILNPVISYPDYRAYKIRFYYTYLGVDYFLKDYELKTNSVHNIGYYSTSVVEAYTDNGQFLPNFIAIPAALTTPSPMPTDNPSDDSVIHDTNRMQVSGIFNPFIWPAINSYRFGLTHNELIAIQSVQSQMSDSQFGQYPLYIFSKQGVFTIMVGNGEVLYSSIQPLNNDILLTRDSLRSINSSIVFATKEGIRVLSGSQSELLSVPVAGSISNPVAQDSHFISALTELGLPIINSYRSGVTFESYIQGCKIFYDVQKEEIIVSNPNYNYSYTFSLQTKSWATRTETFTDEMFISGRSIGVKAALTLHYLDTEESTDSSVCKYLMFQTRPVNIATRNTKRIDRLVLRAMYENQADEYSIFQVYGSNDLVNYNIITYQQCLVGGDVYTSRLLGNYKYFIVVFACNRLESTVHQMDMIYSEKFAKLIL